jgi:hypothetical protein
VVPCRITPKVVLHYLAWIFSDFGAKETVILTEVHPCQFAGIKQPIIVIWQLNLLGHITSEVTNVFTRGVRELSSP